MAVGSPGAGPPQKPNTHNSYNQMCDFHCDLLPNSISDYESGVSTERYVQPVLPWRGLL
jgi:hypothetical protein